jgi:hypothetical protein
MIKKIIFTALWTLATLVVAAMLLGVAEPLFPKVSGPIDEHTPTNVKLVYAFVPLTPIVIAAVFLLLGVLGKLPGTKRYIPK